jgi:hypothetical protein
MAKARRRSALLVPRLRPAVDVSLEPTLSAATRTAIEPFAGDVIGKMVVICAVLRAVTGRPVRHRHGASSAADTGQKLQDRSVAFIL